MYCRPANRIRNIVLNNFFKIMYLMVFNIMLSIGTDRSGSFVPGNHIVRSSCMTLVVSHCHLIRNSFEYIIFSETCFMTLTSNRPGVRHSRLQLMQRTS